MLLGTVTPKSIILNSIYYKKESCYKWISVLKQITSNLLASFILMRQSLIEVLSLLKLYSISLMPATIKLFFFFLSRKGSGISGILLELFQIRCLLVLRSVWLFSLKNVFCSCHWSPVLHLPFQITNNLQLMCLISNI